MFTRKRNLSFTKHNLLYYISRFKWTRERECEYPIDLTETSMCI